MPQGELVRMAAFTDAPAGGNPAGVWLGDTLPPASEMRQVAAEVGYSETAFIAPTPDTVDTWVTRYYSPEMEVSFCGHATIAAAIVLSKEYGDRTYHLQTSVGVVPVEVDGSPSAPRATLTSVSPKHRDCPRELLDRILQSFGWVEHQLDPTLPPALSYAGAWHLILALRSRDTLTALDYDFDTVRQSMADNDLTTLQIVWRQDAGTFHARNPFPVGGVVEDPATGAAAAALGAYLRDRAIIATPVDFVVHQGHDMGRPSHLAVHVPDSGGIRVTGTAVPIPEAR